METQVSYLVAAAAVQVAMCPVQQMVDQAHAVKYWLSGLTRRRRRHPGWCGRRCGDAIDEKNGPVEDDRAVLITGRQKGRFRCRAGRSWFGTPFLLGGQIAFDDGEHVHHTAADRERSDEMTGEIAKLVE